MRARKIYLCMLLSVFFISCSQNTVINEAQTSELEKISVTTSIIPLSSLIHTVG